jgi:endonuclease/exonuclease/phosphatase family metal-dependent hydrolase
MAAAIQNFKLMSWNLRGINNPAKQEDVRQVIAAYRPDLVCLQETKMQSINVATVRSTLGADLENNFLFLPAMGSRGGILVVDYHFSLWSTRGAEEKNVPPGDQAVETLCSTKMAPAGGLQYDISSPR